MATYLPRTCDGQKPLRFAAWFPYWDNGDAAGILAEAKARTWRAMYSMGCENSMKEIEITIIEHSEVPAVLAEVYPDAFKDLEELEPVSGWMKATCPISRADFDALQQTAPPNSVLAA